MLESGVTLTVVPRPRPEPETKHAVTDERTVVAERKPVAALRVVRRPER